MAVNLGQMLLSTLLIEFIAETSKVAEGFLSPSFFSENSYNCSLVKITREWRNW